MNKKKVIKIILLSAILIIIALLIYLNFFYYAKCEDKSCFDSYLKECKRASFTKQGNITLKYLILGEKDDNCKVHMRLLSINLAEVDEIRLIGKSMFCEIPKGIVIEPESQIDNCHGLLKEELQNMIISNLHRQIVQNLREINQDISG